MGRKGRSPPTTMTRPSHDARHPDSAAMLLLARTQRSETTKTTTMRQAIFRQRQICSAHHFLVYTTRARLGRSRIAPEGAGTGATFYGIIGVFMLLDDALDATTHQTSLFCFRPDCAGTCLDSKRLDLLVLYFLFLFLPRDHGKGTVGYTDEIMDLGRDLLPLCHCGYRELLYVCEGRRIGGQRGRMAREGVRDSMSGTACMITTRAWQPGCGCAKGFDRTLPSGRDEIYKRPSPI